MTTRAPAGGAALMVLLLAAGACAGDPPATIDDLARLASREEGVVRTYGMPAHYGGYGGFFDLFEQTYGIRRVDIDMSSTAVLRRLTEERDAPVVDAAVAGYLFGPAAAEEGLLDCVPSPAAELLPAWATGPDEGACRSWFATFTGTLGFMVNTEVIASPPRSWSELTREDLRGQISYIDPRAAATGIATLMTAAMALGGSAADVRPGAELLVEIARTGGMGRVLTRQDYDGFIRGTRPILINYDYNLLQIRENYGVDCVFVYPAEGTVRVPYSTFLVRDRPHPATGRLLVEFLLSPEGQARLAEGYVTPILPGVPAAPQIERLAAESGSSMAILDVDWREAGQRVDEMRATFDELIAPLEGGGG